MKIEGIVNVDPQIASGKKKDLRWMEAEKIVDTFFDAFKELAGKKKLQKWQVINIFEVGDENMWPTLAAFRMLTPTAKSMLYSKIRTRIGPLLAVIRSRCAGGFRVRYEPSYLYMGDARIALYWRYRKLKVKEESNEAGTA